MAGGSGASDFGRSGEGGEVAAGFADEEEEDDDEGGGVGGGGPGGGFSDYSPAATSPSRSFNRDNDYDDQPRSRTGAARGGDDYYDERRPAGSRSGRRSAWGGPGGDGFDDDRYDDRDDVAARPPGRHGGRPEAPRGRLPWATDLDDYDERHHR